MFRRYLPAIIAVVVFITAASLKLVFSSRSRRNATPSTDRSDIADPKKTVKQTTGRIVSTAPSITEILFALGLGDRVAGVTKFCDYPPEAKTKPKIGGYSDLDIEKLMRLKPDLVIVTAYGQQVESTAFLKSHGIRTLQVDQNSISGIMDSIRLIGNACGVTPSATRLLDDITRRMKRVRDTVAGLTSPRVLVIYGGMSTGGELKNICAAGAHNVYNEMISAGGGRNAYQNGTQVAPTLSLENVIRMNPDVIVELTFDPVREKIMRQPKTSEWYAYPQINAVKNDRVYVIIGSFVQRPSQRFIQTIEALAKIIHPEADWRAP